MGGVLNRFGTPLLWLTGFAFFTALTLAWLTVCYTIAFVPASSRHAAAAQAIVSYLMGPDIRYRMTLPLLFLAFAFFYLVFRLVFGVSADARLVQTQFWATSLGAALILGPIIGFKLFGLPSRGVDDERLFALCGLAAWMGYAIIWLGTLVVVFVVFDALRRRHRAVESASET